MLLMGRPLCQRWEPLFRSVGLAAKGPSSPRVVLHRTVVDNVNLPDLIYTVCRLYGIGNFWQARTIGVSDEPRGGGRTGRGRSARSL
jgi:hypothetical protein